MRAKSLVLLGASLTGAVGLLAGSQVWVQFMIDSDHAIETVTGHDVNAALTPIFIALIAAALALTIAGPIFRRILGALVSLLGSGAAALSLVVLSNPLAALAGRVTELTGISGDTNLESVTWSSVTAWGYVSVAAGIIAALLGIFVLITGGRWVAGGRKYASTDRVSTAGAPDRISDWDALSDGDDPTSSED